MQTAEILIFAKKVEVKIRFSLFICMSIKKKTISMSISLSFKLIIILSFT